ncbi:MAG: hypothetical protein H6Q67_1332 [Firmicutes bacterium]|nr:hypothetical protein [Bacillota bacterium]
METIKQFLSGGGTVFLEIFVTLVIYLLFVFIVPDSFGRILKWSAAMSGVTYIAQWLTTK